MFHCAICVKELFTQDPKKFFCRDCYKQWESEILAKTNWTKVCINDEHQQRRRALRDRGLIYLGDEFDVGDFNGEFRLVPMTCPHKGYHTLS
jgi:hypothetical protein